jgi:hypothetical protein
MKQRGEVRYTSRVPGRVRASEPEIYDSIFFSAPHAARARRHEPN